MDYCIHRCPTAPAKPSQRCTLRALDGALGAAVYEGLSKAELSRFAFPPLLLAIPLHTSGCWICPSSGEEDAAQGLSGTRTVDNRTG